MQGTKAIVIEGKPRTIRPLKSCVATVEGWQMCDLTVRPHSHPTEGNKSSGNSQRGEFQAGTP